MLRDNQIVSSKCEEENTQDHLEEGGELGPELFLLEDFNKVDNGTNQADQLEEGPSQSKEVKDLIHDFIIPVL